MSAIPHDLDGLETLGGMADRLDNAVHASALPISADIHKQLLTEIVREIRDELKAFCVERGFDPWGEE